jgi:hypothetical protein
MQRQGMSDNAQLHERQVAEFLLVSRYGPLALLHHVLDRLEDARVRLADFLDLRLHVKSSPCR